MADLFSLLSPEDQAKTKAWAQKRMEAKYKRDIPPNLYLAAQLGFYYGWQAVVDFRRGYHEGIDEKGNRVKIPFQFEEASAFVEAAEKVNYRQMLDQSRSTAAAQVSSNDPDYARQNAEYVNGIAEKCYQ